MATAYPRSLLVTGANRVTSLGIEFVRQVIANNNGATHHIFATHRRPDPGAALEDLAKAHSIVHLVQLDVTDEESIKAAVQTVDAVVGEHGLNVLINNCGHMGAEVKIDDITTEVLTEALMVNTVGPMITVKHFRPLLKRAADLNADKPLSWERAAVLYLSSILGSTDLSNKPPFPISIPQLRHYSFRVSKSAVTTFCHAASVELSSEGIGSMVLHPGYVKTSQGTGELVPAEAISSLLKVIATLNKDNNGGFYTYDGETLPW